MMKKMMVLWVTGLLTVVPLGIYYLLFHAERSEYAVLIVLVLFWIFGYWGVVGPVVSALKVRRFFQAIEQCRSREDLARMFHEQANEAAIIELIARENRLPKPVARWLYHRVLVRLQRQEAGSSRDRCRQEN